MSWDILLDILIMLGAALALGTIAEQLRQSAILGYVAAGTLVGPNVFGFVAQGDHVRAIAELGVALLLFSIGLEFSFRRLVRLGRVALLGGMLQVVGTLVVAAAVSAGFGLGFRAAMAVGAMVCLSSTACVLRLLTERGEIDSMHGRHALGILLLQDVAVIPLMLLVVVLAGEGTVAGAAFMMGETVLLTAVLIGAFLLLFNFVVPRLLNIERWSRNRELPVLLAIVLAIGSAYAAHAVALSPALGAFIAGVLLGESPFAPQIRADIGSLRTLFVTIFFASIGMLGDPTWIAQNVLLVGGAVVFIVLGKALLVWGVIRGLGATHGVALATGLCVAQVGEFSFVLAETARLASTPLISLQAFNLLVSVTILTLFITPFLIAAAPRVGAVVTRLSARHGGSVRGAVPSAAESPMDRPIVIIGFGPSGQAIARKLYRRDRDRITVVELNRRSASVAERLGLRVQLGDATHPDVLEHAGVEHATVIAVTVPDPDVSRAIILACRPLAPTAAIVVRGRYHTRLWESVMAGARDVVDEEEQVGRRMALITRRHDQTERRLRDA